MDEDDHPSLEGPGFPQFEHPFENEVTRQSRWATETHFESFMCVSLHREYDLRTENGEPLPKGVEPPSDAGVDSRRFGHRFGTYYRRGAPNGIADAYLCAIAGRAGVLCFAPPLKDSKVSVPWDYRGRKWDGIFDELREVGRFVVAFSISTVHIHDRFFEVLVCVFACTHLVRPRCAEPP